MINAPNGATVRSISGFGSESERDDVGNISERADGTVAHKAAKASLREVLGPQPAFCQEILACLLRYSVSKPAIPFPASGQ